MGQEKKVAWISRKIVDFPNINNKFGQMQQSSAKLG